MADGRLGTVSELSELYLGNILYALERCAMSLHAEGNAEGAAYYRGIARALADARGRAVGAAAPGASAEHVVQPDGGAVSREHP